MIRYDVQPETKLYRILPNTDLKYTKTGSDGISRMTGNPNSVASKIEAIHTLPREHFLYNLIPQDQRNREVVRYEYGTVTAQSLGPTLNVAILDPSGYGRSDDSIIIEITMDDVIKSGGSIFRDHGAMAQGIKPYIVTIPNPVVFVISESPPSI